MGLIVRSWSAECGAGRNLVRYLRGHVDVCALATAGGGRDTRELQPIGRVGGMTGAELRW